MSPLKIIRAWKDEEFRQGLSEAERALLPEHPAGLVHLDNAELGAVDGGLFNTNLWCSYIGGCISRNASKCC
jgi:mersacidin/lichenicidin family type 2 lantibiotic